LVMSYDLVYLGSAVDASKGSSNREVNRTCQHPQSGDELGEVASASTSGL
jgi:hypothetical protein